MKLMLKRILVILMIICSVFPIIFSGPAVVLADEPNEVITLERAGNYVANFAINFYNNWSSKTYSYSTIKTKYNDSESEISKSVTSDQEQYVFSNKSWIDFVFKNSLTLQDQKFYPSQDYSSNNYYKEYGLEELENMYAKDEENTDKSQVKSITELVNHGAILPGDILYTTEGEYLLFVGGVRVIYAKAPENTNNEEEQSALRYEYLQDYLAGIERKYRKEHQDEEDYEIPVYGVTHIYKMSDNLLKEANITESKANIIFNNKGYYDENNKYQGIPPQGSYSGSTNQSLIEWLIKSLYDIAKWLINLILFVVRMVIVGWVNVVESSIQTIVLKLSGHTNQVSIVDKIEGVSSTSYAGERITVESLFFNKLPLVDANFFNFETAGGQSLIDAEGNKTLLYNLRQTLAIWYVIIRNISIALILFVLIYMGIRMAISTLAPRKAKYKQYLIDWVVALGIVVFIHFFMYAVLYINDTFVGILSRMSSSVAGSIIGAGASEASLYDAVRTKAYTFNALDGTAGLILYIMLVYFFIRYLLIYFKRLVSVYVLGLMGSFMGVKYAFDRANGKKRTSLTKWIKDFSFNVLLQSIHCLMYSLLMVVALQISMTSVMGIIVAILILQFMLTADKTFMKIFGIKSDGGLFEDSNKPENYFTILGKLGLLTAMVRAPIRGAAGLFNGNSKIGQWLKYNRYNKYYAEPGDTVDDIERKMDLDKYGKLAKRAEREEGLLSYIRSIDRKGYLTRIASKLPIHELIDKHRERRDLYKLLGSDVSYTTKKNIYDSLQKSKQFKKKRFTRTIGKYATIGKGAFETIASVAMLTEGVTPAIHMASKGISDINKGRNKNAYRIYRRLNPEEGLKPGALSDVSFAEAKAREKEEKDAKKLAEKKAALREIVRYERDINGSIDELNSDKIRSRIRTQLEDRERHLRTEQGDSYVEPTHEEMERKIDEVLMELWRRTVHVTDRTNINHYYIDEAIVSYMTLQGKRTIDEKDIDGILKQLQDVLKTHQRSGYTGIQLDDETLRSIREHIKSKIKSGETYERKDAVAMFSEGVSEPEAIEVSFLSDQDKKQTDRFLGSLLNDKNPENAELIRQLRAISAGLKKMYSVNERNAARNKNTAIGYHKAVSEMTKRLGGGKNSEKK